MLFARVLCAIDPGPESLMAARQVARLSPPGTPLLLVSVTQPFTAVPGGAGGIAVPVLETRRDAEEALERAKAAVARRQPVETLLLEGAPIPTLLATVDREGATLLAIGIHERSRALGVALGSVATAMLHDAAASVYVARPWRGAGRIAVGLDGSPESAAALAAARELAARTGDELRLVVALGGKEVVLDAARRTAGETRIVEDERDPVDALANTDADLVIVGSRGLHGMRALGSVGERVAHQARCPVLVVRDRQAG